MKFYKLLLFDLIISYSHLLKSKSIKDFIKPVLFIELSFRENRYVPKFSKIISIEKHCTNFNIISITALSLDNQFIFICHILLPQYVPQNHLFQSITTFSIISHVIKAWEQTCPQVLHVRTYLCT